MCSCTYQGTGWCKHIVASLLCVMRHNQLSGDTQRRVSLKDSSKQPRQTKKNRKSDPAIPERDNRPTATPPSKTNPKKGTLVASASKGGPGGVSDENKTKKTTQRVYVPKYRSGAWALLVALSRAPKDAASPHPPGIPSSCCNSLHLQIPRIPRKKVVASISR